LNKKVPSFIDCIGKGTGLATTNQAALNIKEVAKIYSESISASMFRHGPIEIIDECFRAIIISNNDNDRSSINTLVRNIANKWGGKLFLITNSRDQVNEFEENKNILVLFHSTTDPFMSPLYEIIPIQILYYSLAELKGITPGTFRFTSKVTKEF
jgi:glucosamine--fructose-6-phosphate aminotransferase (isomerizing)